MVGIASKHLQAFASVRECRAAAGHPQGLHLCSCRRFWTLVSSLRVKSVKTHRDGVALLVPVVAFASYRLRHESKVSAVTGMGALGVAILVAASGFGVFWRLAFLWSVKKVSAVTGMGRVRVAILVTVIASGPACPEWNGGRWRVESRLKTGMESELSGKWRAENGQWRVECFRRVFCVASLA